MRKLHEAFMYHLWADKDDLIQAGVNLFPPMAQQPLLGHGLLIDEASRSHSDTPHSVGLLWVSGQPTAETST
jgi:hypothetical protein